jgi:hypothetical protein
MSKLLSGALPPIKEVVPDVSAPLEAIVAKALAMDPDDRFANCIEMKRALDAAILELEDQAADDISGAMTTLFHEDREQHRTKVAAQIQAAMDEDQGAADVANVTPTPAPADGSHAALSVNAQRSSLVAPSQRFLRPSALILNGGVLAIVLVLGLGWWMWQPANSTPRLPTRSAKSVGASLDRSSRPRLARGLAVEPAGAGAAAASASSESVAVVSPKPHAVASPAPSVASSATPSSPSSSSSAETPKRASTRDLDRENPWK